MIKTGMGEDGLHRINIPGAANTLAARERLPLCKDICFMPARLERLLIVCWSESRAQ